MNLTNYYSSLPTPSQLLLQNGLSLLGRTGFRLIFPQVGRVPVVPAPLEPDMVLGLLPRGEGFSGLPGLVTKAAREGMRLV